MQTVILLAILSLSCTALVSSLSTVQDSYSNADDDNLTKGMKQICQILLHKIPVPPELASIDSLKQLTHMDFETCRVDKHVLTATMLRDGNFILLKQLCTVTLNLTGVDLRCPYGYCPERKIPNAERACGSSHIGWGKRETITVCVVTFAVIAVVAINVLRSYLIKRRLARMNQDRIGLVA